MSAVFGKAASESMDAMDRCVECNCAFPNGAAIPCDHDGFSWAYHGLKQGPEAIHRQQKLNGRDGWHASAVGWQVSEEQRSMAEFFMDADVERLGEVMRDELTPKACNGFELSVITCKLDGQGLGVMHDRSLLLTSLDGSRNERDVLIGETQSEWFGVEGQQQRWMKGLLGDWPELIMQLFITLPIQVFHIFYRGMEHGEGSFSMVAENSALNLGTWSLRWFQADSIVW